MQVESQWRHKIFEQSGDDFEQIALEVFRFQYANNEIYRAYAQAIKRNPANVGCLADIPFLPIRFFKSHSVATSLFKPELIFESSGTTTTVNSRHLVKDAGLYQESFTRCFNLFYGGAANWCIVGLLPSYLERGNSSLVYMVDKLVGLSGKGHGGFYLDNVEELAAMLQRNEKAGQPTLLLGATFALLDFAEKYSQPLSQTVVMETGGMKGRRKEMIRAEVHAQLASAFGLPVIHSEYGMTELLSQAYSNGGGVFSCPPWMKVLVRDEEDPLTVLGEGKGGINVVDLANLYSCSFIATDDAGMLLPSGRFEVLGRLDGSDLRGCSLLTL